MVRQTLLAFVLAVFSSSAWAGATVQTVTPQLSVNSGEGYKIVTGSTAVSIGDQVMASPGGRGKIVYADGCAVDVYPGAVVTVPVKCYQPMTAGLEVPPPAAVGIPWWLVGGTAAFIGVGICAAQGCFDDDDNGGHRKPPKSP